MNGVNAFSADWQTLRRYNLSEIEKHRQELESLSVAPDRAHQLRGMIAALQDQVAFVEPAPEPDVKGPEYG